MLELKLGYIKKIINKEIPGLIAINLSKGLKNCIVIFEYEGKHYKLERYYNFFLKNEDDTNVYCYEVVLEIKDVEYTKVKESDSVNKKKLLFG